MKSSSLLPLLSVVIFSALSGCGNNTVFQEKILVSDYPSASGIEYLDSSFIVIGDDANNLLFLNNDLKPSDSLLLFVFSEKRIPKSTKADLEGITITRDKKILLLGSGSLSPYRDVAWLVDPQTKQKDIIVLDSFFNRLRGSGIAEINIEGITSLPGNFVLANRGSKGNPKNHLIIVQQNFWKNQHAPITILLAGGSNDTTVFNGISGLAYAPKSDRLVMTVSTEDTRNAMADGAIGKSYLWIIKNFSAKKGWKAINPDQVVDLQSIDAAFKGQKIESVCITNETNDFLHLVLAADNDNGSSSFFKMIVEKD